MDLGASTNEQLHNYAQHESRNRRALCFDTNQLADTTQLPYAAVVKIYYTVAPSTSSTMGMCTGTLITDFHVLTAASCLYKAVDTGHGTGYNWVSLMLAWCAMPLFSSSHDI